MERLTSPLKTTNKEANVDEIQLSKSEEKALLKQEQEWQEEKKSAINHDKRSIKEWQGMTF